MDVCISLMRWEGSCYMSLSDSHGCKIWCCIEQIRVKNTFLKCRELSEWGAGWVVLWDPHFLKCIPSSSELFFFSHKDVGQKWLWSSSWERTQNVSRVGPSMEDTPLEGRAPAGDAISPRSRTITHHPELLNKGLFSQILGQSLMLNKTC